MTQTAKNGKKLTENNSTNGLQKSGSVASQKQKRPGQRQQDKMLRAARRRRRNQIWTSVIVAVVVIIAAYVGIVGYQQYAAQQATAAKKTADAHAAATASVDATQTVAAITPTPSAGPATPPAVTGAPVSMQGGLQYIDVTVGTGAVVQSTSTVSVQYTGWFQSSGKKFDSSYDHGGQPFSVQLGQGQVIPGWDEGLVGMKVGGTRRLIIPPALGYGAAGQPPTIPANSTLIFDVTLLSVK